MSEKIVHIFEPSWATNLDIFEGKHVPSITRIANRHRIERICGSTIPAPIYSKTNEIFIRFSSYHNVDKQKGYRITVEEKGVHLMFSTKLLLPIIL